MTVQRFNFNDELSEDGEFVRHEDFDTVLFAGEEERQILSCDVPGAGCCF